MRALANTLSRALRFLADHLEAHDDKQEAAPNSIERLNSALLMVDPSQPRAVSSSVPLVAGQLHVFSTETQETEPGGISTWYVSGPPGTTVKCLLERVEGSGGHRHSIAGAPVGTATPAQQTLGPTYPQNQPWTFHAPEASGLIKITHRFVDVDDVDYNSVRVPGLTSFGGGRGIILTGARTEHPDNHYGLPHLHSKVATLGKTFYEKFGKVIYVNDMSLSGGGLFDISGRWRTPHRTHRDGRRVDINSTSMNEAEKAFFRQAAQDLRFRTITLETSPEHWHLEI